MPGLLLEEFPDDLHRRLSERAARNHRSMAREALAILQAVLRGSAGPPRLEDVDTWRIKGPKPLGPPTRLRGRPDSLEWDWRRESDAMQTLMRSDAEVADLAAVLVRLVA